MAKVIDEVLDNELEADTLLDDTETSEVIQESEPEEDGLPEKYRNKSLKDIINMHQESEKLIGKQGNEVGELRRTVDDFIKTQTSLNLETHKQPELEETDYYADPVAATRRAIDEHPTVKEAKEATLAMKQSSIQQRVATKFPDYLDTVNDHNFVNWIKSSKVRYELFSRAQNEFDFDAADELLSNWQERQESTRKVTTTSKLDRDKQLKSADVGTSSSTESVAKKKYRRSDIIRLMQTDRDRYDSMATEIMEAYRDGRVV